MLVVIGALAGFFVVPMNALLQHRGHVLMSAGHSIAVQNFNENLNILLMLSIYALLLKVDLHINTIVVLFGLTVVGAMLLVMRLHRANQRKFDSEALIGSADRSRRRRTIRAWRIGRRQPMRIGRSRCRRCRRAPGSAAGARRAASSLAGPASAAALPSARGIEPCSQRIAGEHQRPGVLGPALPRVRRRT